MNSLKTKTPIILFSLLPISIIIGSSISLINIVLFSLFFYLFILQKMILRYVILNQFFIINNFKFIFNF